MEAAGDSRKRSRGRVMRNRLGGPTTAAARSERDASDLGDAAIIIWNFCSRVSAARRSCSSSRVGRGGQALGRRGVQGIAPRRLWRTRGASECGVPTRLRRVAWQQGLAVRIPGEWRGHSSGRRVVAASVPTASAPAPSALVAEYQPGYDGLPTAARRACAPLRIDYNQDFVRVDEARDKALTTKA